MSDNKVEVVGNLMFIQLSANTTPEFIEKKNKEYIFFGKLNNYPSFLLYLYRNHPEHNAIIKAKSKYITGKGLVVKETASLIDRAMGQLFLDSANRFEDWNSVYEKTVKSLEIFNSYVWQIVWGIGGIKCEVYCLQVANFRVSPCGNYYYYCEAWVNDDGSTRYNVEKHESFRKFCAFNPNVRRGTQILYYRVSEQYTEEHGNAYALPEYIGAINPIATDIAIIEYQNALVESGMTAQGMMSLFNGIPDPEAQKKYEKKFTEKFSGPGKAGKIVFNFAEQGSQAAEYTSFQATDMDKLFEGMIKNNQQKIVSGHQIPNKSLVGISVEGALSDRTAIIESFEQLYNTYVEPRQKLITDEIKFIAELNGVDLDIEVHRLAPLGVDVTNPNISKYMSEDEIRSALGLGKMEIKKSPINDALNSMSPLLATKVLESMSEDEIRGLAGLPAKNGVVMPGAAQPVTQINDNLKNLSGRQWQGVKRIEREVKKGTTRREVGAMLLKNGYGLTDFDIDLILGKVQMSAHDFSARFAALAIDEPEGTVIREEYISFRGFALTDGLINSVLDMLNGDPFQKPEQIAKQLDQSVETIKEVINKLDADGLINKQRGKNQPTEEGQEKKAPPVEIEIFTVYKYALAPNVSYANNPNRISSDLLSTSHEFCKDMIALTNAGKVWTREALDSLTNEMGQDAWVYRGGFTMKKGGNVDPYCNHVWKAVVKSRTKK